MKHAAKVALILALSFVTHPAFGWIEKGIITVETWNISCTDELRCMATQDIPDAVRKNVWVRVALFLTNEGGASLSLRFPFHEKISRIVILETDDTHLGVLRITCSLQYCHASKQLKLRDILRFNMTSLLTARYVIDGETIELPILMEGVGKALTILSEQATAHAQKE